MLVESVSDFQTSDDRSLDTHLVALFNELSRTNIRYCLLRGSETLYEDAIDGDIDLLVDPQDFDRLKTALVSFGFVHLEYAGYRPHSFFVNYCQEIDRWIKFDVVTEVAFGRSVKAITTELGEHCLQNRRLVGYLYIPAPEDELIVLLLHCVIDKGAFAPLRRQRIEHLNDQISDGKYLSSLLRYYWSPSMEWRSLSAIIGTGKLSSLLVQRPKVMLYIARHQRIGTLHRYTRQRLARKANTWGTRQARSRSLLVALLAPDGAGKTTLARELTEHFFLPSKYIYMGTNPDASTIGLPTTRWLQSNANRPQHLLAWPVWLLARSVRFINTLAEQWYRYAACYYYLLRGRLVVLDRYIFDAHVSGKRQLLLKSRIRQWLLTRMSPQPELVILLDAPGEILYARKGEHDPAFLEAQRQRYLSLQQDMSQLVVVDATQSADSVRRIVMSLVWQCYGNRARGQ